MSNKFSCYGDRAIIWDYVYYSKHEKEIDQWLEQHDCERQGMVISFCDEQIKTLFLLRWS